MTMYELADTTAEHDLTAAGRRGALVRVILDRRQRSESSPAYQYLQPHGAKVAWSSPRFTYTYQKTLVIDHSTAVILTVNLTSRYYSTSRDSDVAAIEGSSRCRLPWSRRPGAACRCRCPGRTSTPSTSPATDPPGLGVLP
jgi:PLD-like domain